MEKFDNSAGGPQTKAGSQQPRIHTGRTLSEHRRLAGEYAEALRSDKPVAGSEWVLTLMDAAANWMRQVMDYIEAGLERTDPRYVQSANGGATVRGTSVEPSQLSLGDGGIS